MGAAADEPPAAAVRQFGHALAQGLATAWTPAAEAIRDVSTGREYSFLVNSYKPRYYYWEGVDMVRKLLLVGMLVIAGRGSAAQLFLAVLVSCLSLRLQLVLQP